MRNYYITSDLHFMHNKPFLWTPRGFSNEREMCEAIVERWNSIIKPDDVIYNLGDITLSDIDAAIPYLKQLNGHQWWIRGNHDTMNKVKKICDECPRIDTISNPEASWATVIKYGKWSYYLSHYPTLTANFDEKHFSQHVIALHGHTHQQTNFLKLDNPFLYHVGMDSHNCTPVHIDEIISDVRQRWNELGQLPTPNKPEDLYPYGGMI